MKTSAIKLTARFFLLAMFCSLSTSGYSQTMLNVNPRQLSEIIPQQLSLQIERQPGGSSIAIEKIDSVMCDGVTIGYLFYYKNKGFALVPIVKEINPLFAVSGRKMGTEKNAERVETFLKEELEKRYLAVACGEIATRYFKRNEKLWDRILTKNL